ncbi:TIGR04086 family membrane protein [Tissierella pigra]|uniref:TIGR04086 family membrane protein n=1 Tax=Tissierella pigra TaxID=2607614 RepID=A0A6N7Y0C7_9FIRM|nr:TIGR04086 family membrane protein [Tissierella pigra]MBU5426424.1 TIGR04086 family membrane protein [Tissierella pigra]MSU02314.1 TIGR04086 family membrane protein [Tissierella pigra]
MKVKNLDKGIYLLKGLLLSYIVTCILILFFSVLLTYSNMSEGKMPLLNTITMLISITIGSIYTAGKVKEKGWISGGLVGISYYIILIALNMIFLKPLVFDIFSASKIILSSVMGVIGGIIGINLS